jgi:zinc/manganese transport system ATP-binding protein
MSGNPVTPGSPAPRVIDVDGATVTLGGRTIWSNLTASVAAGEFVAVLGPNGVGKSTLLKAILGLQPLASGHIDVLGQRQSGTGRTGTGRTGGGRRMGANRDIGYLPQRRTFDASMRIRGVDVVRLGVDGDRWGIWLPGAASKAANRRVDELVDLVGASAYARRPIGTLSGGEQQRLLIAAALAHRPKVLLLDEPLDSLDLPNQASVAALIARISRSENMAVVMVAHDVNPILSYLDRVIYLASGGAIAGTPREVITSECLTDLYRTPIEVLTTSDGRLVVVGSPEEPAMHADRHGH